MSGAARWAGSLQLDYRTDMLRGARRTVLHDRHDGPLRVLASLYPEDPTICHNVLVHPPGGLVGGDRLDIHIDLQPDAHALITTPGATRYYRTTGQAAVQEVCAAVAEGARLEWLPLESIAYSGCRGENRMRFDLAPGAEMIGWDVVALGLPAASQDFLAGSYSQHIEQPGRWLERAIVDAADRQLLDSPLGWAGRRVLATLWFMTHAGLTPERRDTLLEAARVPGESDSATGATALGHDLVVMRVLTHRVEPAMNLLVRTWAQWRRIAWGLPAVSPRVWRT